MFICASLTGTRKHQVLRPKTVLSLQLAIAAVAVVYCSSSCGSGWEGGMGSYSGEEHSGAVARSFAVAHEYAQLK